MCSTSDTIMYATAYMRLGRAIERERTVKVHIVEFIRILGGGEEQGHYTDDRSLKLVPPFLS